MTHGADVRLLLHVGLIPPALFEPGDVRLTRMPDKHVAVPTCRRPLVR